MLHSWSRQGNMLFIHVKINASLLSFAFYWFAIVTAFLFFCSKELSVAYMFFAPFVLTIILGGRLDGERVDGAISPIRFHSWVMIWTQASPFLIQHYALVLIWCIKMVNKSIVSNYQLEVLISNHYLFSLKSVLMSSSVHSLLRMPICHSDMENN